MSIMVERVAERVPYEGIRAQAREVKPGRTLAALVAAVFYAIGWMARGVVKVLALVLGGIFGGLWYGMAFTGVAIREGWRQGQAPPADRT